MAMISTSTLSQTAPILPSDVWVGWLDQFRSWVEPTTDAALEGVFAVASIQLAIAVGRQVAINFGRPIYSNLYCSLIGQTSVPRKTTILSRGNDIIKASFSKEFINVSRSIGSGEGLLELFCRETKDPKNGKITLEPIPGQRVLLDEPELCNLLKKAGRPGTSNITEILLTLYDGDDLSPRTRNRSIRVENPFFCLVTSTTPENLELSLTEVDIQSGLMPRFGIFYCNPREPMAYPPLPDESELKSLVTELQDITKHAADIRSRLLVLSHSARTEWEHTFKDLTTLTRTQQGLTSAMMARIPAMTMKWALLYTLQAGRGEVNSEDLARASLVGTYFMETSRLIPNLVQKSTIARIETKIVETLRKIQGKYLTANEIHHLVSGRIKADDLRRSLDSLVKLGVIDMKLNEKNIPYYGVSEA
jgi:hypothetical protein